ncbi:hypothetical protein Patl1_26954 [Pistacia atlantica]|uniref:Uncharacterized protein n=1 Tax=Pistacia atlantica TaxID=434234 RepID=A0ACC1B513_9ROSI|nr:hypothetical protein Patl1_26954 [Pistacia atlantica]
MSSHSGADGKSDSTKAFLALLGLWHSGSAMCKPFMSAKERAVLAVRSRCFRGKCKSSKITIRIDGDACGSIDYNVIGKSGNWLFFQMSMESPLMVAFLMDKGMACGLAKTREKLPWWCHGK